VLHTKSASINVSLTSIRDHKYFSEAPPSYLAGLRQSPPTLAIQAHGPSYHGWSSELYIISRRLLAVEIESEDSVEQKNGKTMEALDLSVQRLPRFDLVRPVRRSGDNALIKCLDAGPSRFGTSPQKKHRAAGAQSPPRSTWRRRACSRRRGALSSTCARPRTETPS
jgi:hypothetical protein